MINEKGKKRNKKIDKWKKKKDEVVFHDILNSQNFIINVCGSDL